MVYPESKSSLEPFKVTCYVHKCLKYYLFNFLINDKYLSTWDYNINII